MTPELFERVAADGERRYLQDRLKQGRRRMVDPLAPLAQRLRTATAARS